MATEKDYFSVVNQGYKVFLPVHCVHKMESKSIKIQDDQDSGLKVVDGAVEDIKPGNYFQNTHVTPSVDTSNKHLHSLRYTGPSSGSNMYGIFIVCVLNICYFSVSDKVSHSFKEGSMVEYLGNYGEIKWIGNLPMAENLMAGLEMVL